MSMDVLVESILGQVRTIAEDVVRRTGVRLRTATVTRTSPLRIRYDGEDDASVVTPRTLDPVGRGDRVVVAKSRGQATILGRLGVAEWDTAPLTSGIDAAGHGGPPGIKREGTRRELQGRISRLGNDFAQGEKWLIAELAPDDRPVHTVRRLGTLTSWASPGFVAVEVSYGGGINIAPSRDTSWIGLDGIYWYTE